jgi:phenylacetate-CoA ligase
MPNWRRPLLSLYDRHVARRRVPGYVDLLREFYAQPIEIRHDVQTARLLALLHHASRHVPFYRDSLARAGVARNGRIDIGRFGRLPELTREGLRTHFERLKSDDLAARAWYENSSGGSSGEPVTFLQDDTYRDMGLATTAMHFGWAGWRPGEPLARLWGSERDVLLGSVGWRNKLSAFARNQTVLNAFRMGEAEMARYAVAMRRLKPVMVEAYSESVYEFARYLNAQRIRLTGVEHIVASAGTLYPFMRDEVRRAFGSEILNRYGSREVGDCAAERVPGGGLEVFSYTHLLEVVNRNGEACGEGEEGDVLVTCLTNYAMPLIRYRINDRAVVGTVTSGRPVRVERLQTVTGRTTDAFVREDGTTIPAAFFIHFVGVVHNTGWLKKTQIIQQSYRSILIKLVPASPPPEGALERIRSSLQGVMGPACRIDFEFVDSIAPLPSGKYRYTMSLVPRRAPAACAA